MYRRSSIVEETGSGRQENRIATRPPEASFRGEDTRDLSPNKPPLPEFRLFNQAQRSPIV